MTDVQPEETTPEEDVPTPSVPVVPEEEPARDRETGAPLAAEEPAAAEEAPVVDPTVEPTTPTTVESVTVSDDPAPDITPAAEPEPKTEHDWDALRRIAAGIRSHINALDAALQQESSK